MFHEGGHLKTLVINGKVKKEPRLAATFLSVYAGIPGWQAKANGSEGYWGVSPLGASSGRLVFDCKQFKFHEGQSLAN